MADAPTDNPGASSFNPKFRRRKRHQGGSWTPANASAELGDGAYCRSCRKRHGYMKMPIRYEKGGGGRWQILWHCPVTQEVVETMPLRPSSSPVANDDSSPL